jgi:hypothetical protein
MRSLPFGGGRDVLEAPRGFVEREPLSLSAAERSNGKAGVGGDGAGARPASDSSQDGPAGSESSTESRGTSAAVSTLQAELPDSLFFALVLLEREFEKPAGGPTHHRIVGELARLLREREIETLRRTHEALWAQLPHVGDDLRRVRELIVDHFG